MGSSASSQPQATSLPSAEQTIEPNTTQSPTEGVTLGPLDSVQSPNKSIDHIDIESKIMNEPHDEHAPGRRSRIDDAHSSNISDASSSRRHSESDERDGEIESADKDQMIRRSQQPDAEQTLAEFKAELRVKREQRLSAIADLKNEVIQLRQELAAEREITRQLREPQRGHSEVRRQLLLNAEDAAGIDCTDHCVGNDQKVSTIIAAATPTTTTHEEPSANLDETNEATTKTSSEVASTTTTLRTQLADANHELQLANAENLSLATELTITQRQVKSLKEVIVVTKEMVAIRESQLEQLKTKLKAIEDSLAERELTLMSDTLRKEYDRQLANIRSLRTLYEERSRVNAAEKENLMRQLDTKRTEMEAEIEKCTNLEARVATLEKELEETSVNLTNTKDDLLDSNSTNKSLQEDSAVINQLFSQLLSGFSGGNDLNIDKLASMLENHRDLLSDITNRETCRDGAAALPKLLFDLVSQVEDQQQPSTSEDVPKEENAVETITPSATSASSVATTASSANEIVHNLPKVWKVLIELLNHQKTEQVPFKENGESEDCYNVVQSPSGPEQVLSVSKTYIRLKDLIMEKKSLQKETHKLKNLNTHLETRLNTQEKRLATVTVELNKTWTLVGRMQRQHRQLHTHEQVLRYQLSQKRRLLNELKDELEYCRRKWTLAREKNDESQTQWDSLRQEFNARKLQDAGSQNSTESGFSDDPASDDEGSEVAHQTEEKILVAPLISSQPVLVYTATEVTGAGDGAGGSGVTKLTHPVLSRELRKKKPKKVKTKGAETLEEMFYRLSGMEQPDGSSSEEESEYEEEEEEEVQIEEAQALHTLVAIPEEIVSFIDEEPSAMSLMPESDQETMSDYVDPEDEERRQKRVVRFARLEEQCNQLISQVMKTATRGEELNKQLDDVHNRYRTPTRDSSAASTGAPSEFDAGASTSAGVSGSQETVCMTEKEQEYTSRRAARLKRLEEECKAFLDKVNATNDRATELNTKMDHLHEHHSARLANRVPPVTTAKTEHPENEETSINLQSVGKHELELADCGNSSSSQSELKSSDDIILIEDDTRSPSSTSVIETILTSSSSAMLEYTPPSPIEQTENQFDVQTESENKDTVSSSSQTGLTSPENLLTSEENYYITSEIEATSAISESQTHVIEQPLEAGVNRPSQHITMEVSMETDENHQPPSQTVTPSETQNDQQDQ